jgi:uncharacterized protein YwqG
MLPSARLAAHRVATGKKLALGASRIGGSPDVPSDFVWPEREGEEDGRVDAGSLSFIAQLKLKAFGGLSEDLPRDGWLLFFYDMRNQPWGFDPRDRASCAVVHVPAGTNLRRRPMPEDVDDDEWSGSCCSVTHAVEATVPELGETRADLEMLEPHQAMLKELSPMGAGEPKHRLLGWPDMVQGEMSAECQLVTHGIYCGDAKGYQDPRVPELLQGAADWMLLLQIDTDEDGPGWMWGDCGRIFFWIRRQDLRERRFQRAWCILQCTLGFPE